MRRWRMGRKRERLRQKAGVISSVRDDDRSFPGDKSRLANAAVRSNIYGSSLFPMGEQTKPILSFGGIDRSCASSRDESLKERFDSSSAPVDFWGLLIAGKSSRSAISRPRPLHRRRSVGGRRQRFANWRNLLAVSSADRAYDESPGRVSDRARWAGTSLCPHGMFSMARVNASTGTCPPTSDAVP